MYSIVLMAALATNGPDTTAWGHRHGGYSCCGCNGSYAGCGGCYGGGGGWGSSWGGGNYGVYGCYGVVAYGQYGGDNYHGYCSCFGVYGGTACYGGCYGSCMGCNAHYAGCYGGCYGQPIWYGPSTPYHPVAAPGGPPGPYAPAGNPMTAPQEKPKDGPPAAKPAGGAAKVIFDLPEGANLFVEEQPIKGQAATRQFSTPELVVGQTYYYTVRVESTRDGKPVSESRRVLVRAGDMVRESFLDAKGDAVAKMPR
jgi:uncharacterized protein (TIGR03000 family)